MPWPTAWSTGMAPIDGRASPDAPSSGVACATDTVQLTATRGATTNQASKDRRRRVMRLFRNRVRDDPALSPNLPGGLGLQNWCQRPIGHDPERRRPAPGRPYYHSDGPKLVIRTQSRTLPPEPAYYEAPGLSCQGPALERGGCEQRADPRSRFLE